MTQEQWVVGIVSWVSLNAVVVIVGWIRHKREVDLYKHRESVDERRL